jgi:PAS domain S-box-containing protein
MGRKTRRSATIPYNLLGPALATKDGVRTPPDSPAAMKWRVIAMLTGRPIGRSRSDNSYRRCVLASEGNWVHLGVATSNWSNRLSAYRWFVVLGLLLCVLIRPTAAAQPPPKNVLVLHNWSNLPPSWALMQSTVRARVPGQINFYTASVENPRFDEEEYRESLAETLSRGYSGVKLDLVIASTYPVLQFATQYRDKMFPGVPIVFTDVSSQQAQKIMPDVSGVISVLGMRETIDLALRLHPDTKAVAVITGVTGWDKYWLSVAHAELLRRQDKVKEIDLIGPTGNQILEQVAQLPPHTVVLFQLRPDDFNQPAVDPIDVLTAVAQRVPTYSAWPGLALSRGGIGGAYRDLAKDAVLNGKIVARALLGERPENIPIVHDSYLRVRVDWRALQRWHIAESALPPGSVVENRQPTFWQRKRKYVIIAIVLIVAQALLIAGLLLQRTRKRKAEAVLRESEERFRVMVDSTPSLVWMCDERGRITYLNGRRLAFTGPVPDAGYGDNWITYVHPDDVERMLGTLYEALKTKQPFSQQYRLLRSDGVYRWMFDVASPRVNGDGSFGGFVGSAIDTTDQKLAQQALEKISGQLIEAQEQERSRIARDLHDDVCQRLALLSMEIERANRTSNGTSAATKQDLENIRKHCSEIATDVQSLSHQLHSSTLDYLGVVTAIKSFCNEVSRQHQVSIEFTDSKVPKRLPKDISLCLFRIAQEALHNAVKYSETNKFVVAICAIEDEIQLVVRDAGAGFDVEEARKNRGLGLVSMQERIHLVHGRFAVDSRPGKGTRIFAAVPFVPEKESPREDAPGKKAGSAQEVA